jgi:hypothetical protein
MFLPWKIRLVLHSVIELVLGVLSVLSVLAWLQLPSLLIHHVDVWLAPLSRLHVGIGPCCSEGKDAVLAQVMVAGAAHNERIAAQAGVQIVLLWHCPEVSTPQERPHLSA